MEKIAQSSYLEFTCHNTGRYFNETAAKHLIYLSEDGETIKRALKDVMKLQG